MLLLIISEHRHPAFRSKISSEIINYGYKEAEVIFNTVGNIFSGQVNGRTAEDLSKSFGREFRRRESLSQSLQTSERLP